MYIYKIKIHNKLIIGNPPHKNNRNGTLKIVKI